MSHKSLRLNQCIPLAAALISVASSCFAQSEDSGWQPKPEIVAKFQRRAGFNYDESQVPRAALPTPFLMKSGQPVTPESWEAKREMILNTFRAEMYGFRPAANFQVTFETQAKKEQLFGGKAIGLSIVAKVKFKNRTYSFPFVAFIPQGTQEKCPAVVHINNRGFISLDEAITKENQFWPVRLLIERGYATASFHTSDVDPDDTKRYAEGIRSFFAANQPPSEDSWGSLSAWGWAASQVREFMAQQDSIDANRIAVSGHSRGGKTALWAAAEDSKFSIAYSNNSGCGGAALSRRRFGETVQRITTVFPHWFAKKFADYSDRENELPIDQHLLIGLVAPRGVYVASADEDLWADPRGEYLSLVGAAKIYELLGETSINRSNMPNLDAPLLVGKTGYHIRPGGHGLLRSDWERFLNFCDHCYSQ